MGVACFTHWTSGTRSLTRRFGMGSANVIGDAIISLMSWTFRRIGGRTILSLCLLLLVIGSVASGLQSAVLGLDGALPFLIALLGLIYGWIIARSGITGPQSIIISIGLGIMLLLSIVGRLIDPFLTLLRSLSILINQAFRWPWDGPPDPTLLQHSIEELWSTFYPLITRLYLWFRSLVSGNFAFDGLAIAFIWGMAIWIISVWASWAVRRRQQPLIAIIPAGALLAATLNYVRTEIYTLLPLLAGTLSLTAIIHFTNREKHWQTIGIDYPEDIRIDTFAAIGALTVTLTMLACFVPSLSVKPVVSLARRLFSLRTGETEAVAASLGLHSQNSESLDIANIPSSGLPRRHLLGSGPELSRQVVMIIEVENPSFIANTGGLPQPTNYYWRSVIFDNYTGRGWNTTETELISYAAGEQAIQPSSPAQNEIHQQVKFLQDVGGLVFSAGSLVTIDQDYQVARRHPNDVFAALIDTSEYHVSSLINEVGESQLRATGQQYPDWIAERYLALPESIPQRVIELGQELTASAPTPYDQATAIKAYLRSFPYTLEVSAPPPDRDVSDYFLFDLRKGYCDYYATSMVVLARTAGLPSRLVVGYASGIYDPPNLRYIVTEADAHSWVEVYFPEYGWIEFEPTGGRPSIVRPEHVSLSAVVLSEIVVETSPAVQLNTQWIKWLGVLGGLLLTLTTGVISISLFEYWNLKRQPPTKTILSLYRKLFQHGHHLVVPTRKGDTPYEFAAAMVDRTNDLSHYISLKEVLSTVCSEIQKITNFYVHAIYSPHPISSVEQTQAIQTWKRLRWRLWLVRLARIWKSFRQKLPKLCLGGVGE